MASTSRFYLLEEFFAPSILSIEDGTVTISENPDATPVVGHIPGTSQPSPPYPTFPPASTESKQFNLQQDQQLCFIFEWVQKGFFTKLPEHSPKCHLFQYILEVFFEQIGPGEVPVIPGTRKYVDFYHSPVDGHGYKYSEKILIGTPGTENPLPPGIYAVHARFAWGFKNLPHTPVSGITKISDALNVYTL